MNPAILSYDASGRVRNTVAAPTSFNAGLGFAGALLCAAAGVPSSWVNGMPIAAGGLAFNTGAITSYSGGLPLTASGAIAVELGTAVTQYVQGLPGTATGKISFAAATAVFMAQMEVQHLLIAGQNPAGNRVGYRRNEWGIWLPQDTPLLSRLFTNPNNNRLVVQGDGDLTTVVVSGIHIHRQSPAQDFNFGAPNTVVFDGVNTDFTWIVPFDFLLGESYTVSLS